MRGLFLRRVFSEPTPKTCIISFSFPSGFSVSQSVEIFTSDGTRIYPPDGYKIENVRDCEVPYGETITAHNIWGGITVNGEYFAVAEIEFEINGDVAVTFDDNWYPVFTGLVSNVRTPS